MTENEAFGDGNGGNPQLDTDLMILDCIDDLKETIHKINYGKDETIRFLKSELINVRKELDEAKADLQHYECNGTWERIEELEAYIATIIGAVIP